ncbi:UDP-glucose 4-epimerase GalE [Paracoccus niistensis]|uniref:UDP-glucose 4-epimerase n=1 Tax=Paracoccus niistensis TaxID=632935 RepID=A0ABV6I9B2_9RHOB
MAVLITGGAGYIGSHIALNFLDQGRKVVIVDDLSTGRIELVPNNALFVRTDIRDTATLVRTMQAHQIEAVVHCAASTVVPDSVAKPLDYYENNVGGTISLLRAMKQSSVNRIIFSSTAAVYGIGDGTPLNEESPLDPASPYGTTKLIAEKIIRDIAATNNLSFVILRYFNVAGADPLGRAGQATPNATHLIKLALEAACGIRPNMTIYGTDWPTHDGTGVRDFIHVSDLASAHSEADAYLSAGGDNQILNCGYGQGYSVKQVVDVVQSVSGTTLQLLLADRRPGDLPQVIADPTRLMTLLDWKPRYNSIETIIRHAFAWESMRAALQQ